MIGPIKNQSLHFLSLSRFLSNQPKENPYSPYLFPPLLSFPSIFPPTKNSVYFLAFRK